MTDLAGVNHSRLDAIAWADACFLSEMTWYPCHWSGLLNSICCGAEQATMKLKTLAGGSGAAGRVGRRDGGRGHRKTRIRFGKGLWWH